MYLVMFFGVVQSSQAPAEVQESPGIKIIITNVIPFAFSDVMVQAQVRDFGNNSVSGHEIEGLELLENQKPVVFQHQLKNSVEDKLGVQGNSKVRLIDGKPAEPTTISLIPSQSPCEGEDGLSFFLCQVRSVVSTPAGWISILSLLIALGALAITWFYQGRIREASGAAMERVRDSVTHRRNLGDSRVGAFLEVLSIDDPLSGKQIPLYINKVTLVGRSPQEAELVFDMTKERSVVSRLHCEFREEDGLFKIRDRGSTHGTFLNGIRVPDSGDGLVLSEGDRIELGPIKHGGFLLLFHVTYQLKRKKQARETKNIDRAEIE